MYRWLVLLHIITAFAFIGTHGVSIAAHFRLSKVTTP